MTIETVVNKTIQSGNGSNKDFSFAFEIPDEDSLSLTKRGADGTETAITTNYTVTGLGDEAGGSVNYPTSGSALSSSEKIIIKRVVSLKQLINLRNQGDYSLEDIEDALDYSVMLCQQLQEQVDRCLKLNLTSSSTYVNVADFVANKLLVVSADGQSIRMSSADYGSIDAYLSTLVAIADDISTVAGIVSDVSAVAAIDSDVTAVVAIATDVSAVAAIDTDVSEVAAIVADISALAALTTEIAAIYANLSDIQNAASFNFPTLGGSDAGKFLKVNDSSDGYDLITSLALTLIANLTPATDKIPYFNSASTAALLTLGSSLGNIPQVGIISGDDTKAGLLEVATSSEIDAGSDTTRSFSPASFLASRYGKCRRIARLTASNSASLDQALSTGKKYRFDFYGILPANNGVMLTAQLSTNGGSTIINSSYLQRYSMSSSSDPEVSVTGKTSGFSLAGHDGDANRCAGNTSTRGGINGFMELYDPSNSSIYKQCLFFTTFPTHTSFNYHGQSEGVGIYTGATTAINYIQFKFKTANSDTDSGNIASGYIDVWEFE